MVFLMILGKEQIYKEHLERIQKYIQFVHTCCVGKFLNYERIHRLTGGQKVGRHNIYIRILYY